MLELDQLQRTLQLPDSTRKRVAASLEQLTVFPLLGRTLVGDLKLRYVIGPWPWMMLVYRFDEARDRVVVVSVQDLR